MVAGEQQQNEMFGQEQRDRTLEGNSTQEQKVEMREDGRRGGEGLEGMQREA